MGQMVGLRLDTSSECEGHRAEDLTVFETSYEEAWLSNDDDDSRSGRRRGLADPADASADPADPGANETAAASHALRRRSRTGSGDFSTGVLTNGELFLLSSPHDYHMAYIYGDFLWPHCAEEGFAFKELAWGVGDR